MPSDKVRSDFDELSKIGQLFNAQSSAIGGVNRRMKSAQGTLEGGDWIGEGAKKFFAEMEQQVNPSMKRLEQSLADAYRKTQEIARIMKQAEDEASNIFKLL
jgi:WXG100 family type VII secretion target